MTLQQLAVYVAASIQRIAQEADEDDFAPWVSEYLRLLARQASDALLTGSAERRSS